MAKLCLYYNQNELKVNKNYDTIKKNNIMSLKKIQKQGINQLVFKTILRELLIKYDDFHVGGNIINISYDWLLNDIIEHTPHHEACEELYYLDTVFTSDYHENIKSIFKYLHNSDEINFNVINKEDNIEKTHMPGNINSVMKFIKVECDKGELYNFTQNLIGKIQEIEQEKINVRITKKGSCNLEYKNNTCSINHYNNGKSIKLNIIRLLVGKGAVFGERNSNKGIDLTYEYKNYKIGDEVHWEVLYKICYKKIPTISGGGNEPKYTDRKRGENQGKNLLRKNISGLKTKIRNKLNAELLISPHGKGVISIDKNKIGTIIVES